MAAWGLYILRQRLGGVSYTPRMFFWSGFPSELLWTGVDQTPGTGPLDWSRPDSRHWPTELCCAWQFVIPWGLFLRHRGWGGLSEMLSTG